MDIIPYLPEIWHQTELYSKLLETGVLLEVRKCANIIPKLKKDARNLPENRRLISLTNELMKVLTKLNKKAILSAFN